MKKKFGTIVCKKMIEDVFRKEDIKHKK
jgi:hypothetical protein